MAVQIGPKIGIEGEKEFRQELKNIIEQTKTFDSELKKLKKTFDDDTSVKKKNKQQAEILRKEQASLEEQVKRLKDQTQKSAEKFGENSTETLKWKQALTNAEGKLADVNRELSNVTGAKAFKAEMDEIGTKLQTIGKNAEKVGKNLTKYVTGSIVGVGTASVKTFMDFEAEMSRVEALSGATADEVEDLTNLALEMGETTLFSATESAQALEYMALAGWKTKDMMSGLEGIMDLAAASGEDLATVSDIVTDALTAFGKSAGEAGTLADILAATAANSNTNVAMLGESFKYAAPLAGAMGYSMEDVSIALGLMANSGIKATQAGTSLRNIMTRMASPTKESQEAMDALGLSLTDSEGNMKSFGEVMDDIRAGFPALKISQEELTAIMTNLDARLEEGSITEEEYAEAVEDLTEKAYGAEGAMYAQYASMLAGKYGLSGLLAIVNSSDEDYANLTAAINGSTGAADQMAAVVQDNLSGQLTLLKSAVESGAIAIGKQLAPQISALIEKINSAVKWFNSLDDSQKQQIVRMAEIVAAVGPAILVFGKLTSGLGAAFKMAGTLGEGISKLATGFNPWMLAVGAVVAGCVLIYQNWDMIVEKIEWVREKIGSAIQSIREKFNFQWSFPSLKLPHFSVSGGFSVNPLSIPKFSVSWYDKAKNSGLLFNNATIFGTGNGKMMGAGETNRELLIGYDNLMDMISNAAGKGAGNEITLNVYGAAGQDVNELADIVMDRMTYLLDRSGRAWT